MKKIIIAVVILAVVAAAGVGAYFGFFADKGDEAAVYATMDEIIENPNLLAALIKSPDRYHSLLSDTYELGDSKTDEFYAAPEEWLTYEQLITIKNATEDDITVYGFEVENNGKKDVYISTDIGGELGILPGGSGPASFSVLCSNGELSTDEVKEIVDSMKINIIYTKTPEEFDDGTLSVEETKIVTIEKPEIE